MAYGDLQQFPTASSPPSSVKMNVCHHGGMRRSRRHKTVNESLPVSR
ncbi:hypothetical protein OPKNFCMD_6913 [Methylobacterium crusticola]|uniref:Uncharacterized protein n=1 Tax=Methylobacterium crusticola TaxID=1697972 RepID=A0ABQ4R8R4_9HYPH|nr:hypothetical protein OPKNFCMD_6913 [Methylobacterium crusticola]